MRLDLDLLKQIATRPMNAKSIANAESFIVAFNQYGKNMGVDIPHRLTQLLAQLFHESAEFKYDRELWGPTAAQKRYEGRKDLGNVRKGDGSKFRGRASIQITGRANYAEFTKWCRTHVSPKAPDFTEKPELINTDPWEGLVPLWYWDTRKINRHADQGDIEMVTKKINGGLNGFDDRLKYYARASLVILNYPVGKEGVEKFQRARKLHVDGITGPKTRSELHKALVKMTAPAMQPDAIQAAPVTEDVPVAVAPEAIDKPIEKTTGFWERITSIGGLLGAGGATFLGVDWRVIVAIVASLIVLALVGLLLHKRIVDAVKCLKEEINHA